MDYGKLKTDEYANVLSDKDTNEVEYLSKKQNGNFDMTDFDGAKEVSDILLNKAYKNFKTKCENNDPKAIRLNNEFEEYKNSNNNWLEKNSVFHILTKIHGTDNFTKWDNDVDKELISRKEKGDEVANYRYKQLTTNPKYKSEIDEYEFSQFLINKQEKKDKELREKDGIKFIGDLLVGYSNSDEWSNPRTSYYEIEKLA